MPDDVARVQVRGRVDPKLLGLRQYALVPFVGCGV